MSPWIFLVRFLALLTLAVWVGGFGFYSAVVIPELHDAIGSLETGYITQRVTVALNVIGAAAVAAWWVVAITDRGAVRGWPGRTRLGLLAATTVLLVFLLVAHREMDRRLGAGRLRGFYPLHRAYLIASTAQWFTNLGLLAGAVGAWGRRKDRSATE